MLLRLGRSRVECVSMIHWHILYNFNASITMHIPNVSVLNSHIPSSGSRNCMVHHWDVPEASL
jgi:hypothetical protein